MVYYKWMDSSLGALLLTADGRSLTGVYLQGQKYLPVQSNDWQESNGMEILGRSQAQLTEYFARQRQQFELPLAPQGTEFQQRVWQALRQIPFGETISYKALAQHIGQPAAVRAVGAANGRNPLAIVVPCHRVVAANGALTGYAGGVERKQWLLHHEQGTLQGELAIA